MSTAPTPAGGSLTVTRRLMTREPFRLSPPAITSPKGEAHAAIARNSRNPVTPVRFPFHSSHLRVGDSRRNCRLRILRGGGGRRQRRGSFSAGPLAPSPRARPTRGCRRYRDAVRIDLFSCSPAPRTCAGSSVRPRTGPWIAAHTVHTRDPRTSWYSTRPDAVSHPRDAIDGYQVRLYRPRIEGGFATDRALSKPDQRSRCPGVSISRDNTPPSYGNSSTAGRRSRRCTPIFSLADRRIVRRARQQHSSMSMSAKTTRGGPEPSERGDRSRIAQRTSRGASMGFAVPLVPFFRRRSDLAFRSALRVLRRSFSAVDYRRGRARRRWHR